MKVSPFFCLPTFTIKIDQTLLQLASIDNMRVDGKFMVGNDIPEGQGRVNSLLSECFEICHELRNSEDR